MDPVIHLRSAVALLGRFPALAGVDLDVSRGEIVLLRGPNGAGKTTVLRACAGLVPIVDGVAEVLGCDLRAGRARDGRDRRGLRGRVGLLGHGTGLYDELTVADNARFWCRAAGVAPDRAEEALHTLGLVGRLRDTPVGRLSTGQRRRAALAVLVARRPELWLLDEPHAGLDPDGRALVDRLVRAAAAAGATVLVASHEHGHADALASRAVTLVGGRIDGGSPPADAVEGSPDTGSPDTGSPDGAWHDAGPPRGASSRREASRVP